MIELQKIIDKKIIQGDPKLKAKYGQIKLQYNWGQGNMLDVLETFYQLKEAGQQANIDDLSQNIREKSCEV
ncbi:MAG: hypothetical protein ACI81I_000173 [Arcobacteraceae bacterium]|jgi:hypothetical protein